jgi:hypothetical protein
LRNKIGGVAEVRNLNIVAVVPEEIGNEIEIIDPSQSSTAST